MNPNVERLALLLAASGLSDKVIHDAIRELRSVDEKELVERIRFLRGFLFSQLARRQEQSKAENTRAVEAARRLEIAVEIIRLLQIEAKLPTARAADLLTQSFLEEKPKGAFPKYRPKEGLRAWLTRLPFSSSELLHHATKIRNRVMHAEGTAWPLRERSG